MTRIRLVRLCAALGVVFAAMFMTTPLDAHHSVDFDSHNCGETEESPPPAEDPELTPPPEDPDAEQPPPSEETATPAPQNCMPMEGERIWGNRLLAFSASTDGARPLKSVSLKILSEEKAIPSAQNGEPLLLETYERGEDVRAYDTPFSWNSVDATPHNGKYKVRVEVDTYPAVTGNEAHRAMNERIHLRVDNPPKQLDAPKVIATTFSNATIQWKGGTEPDILTYTVYRATTTSQTKRPRYTDFRQVGVTSGAAFRDSTVKPGVHWYTVRPTRRSVVTPKEGISGPMSQMSGPAEVKSLQEIQKEKDDGKPTKQRFIPYRQLAPPRSSSRLANVADAPFTYKLPVADNGVDFGGSSEAEGSSREPSDDPRGPVLPVAVGMFLLSSALAVGRMPY